MIRTKWPAWHRDQELKAEHLLGLEDYLLTRVLIVDEFAFGIDFIDFSNSLVLAAQDANFTISATNLRGATPAGQPVHLSSAQSISMTFQSPADCELDLWIEVNHHSEDEKLVLQVDICQSGSQPLPAEQEHPEHLYLGRYRMAATNEKWELKLVQHPIPRRFAGFLGDTTW